MFLPVPLHACCVTTDRNADWQRFGRLVKERRIALGMRTSKALAEKVGVVPRLVGDIENGRRDSYSLSTMLNLADALGWEDAYDVALGGDPVEVEPRKAQPPGDDAEADLSIAYLDWAMAHVEALSNAFKYALARRIELGEAHQELEQTFVMSEQLKDGRPWTPPWWDYPDGFEPWKEEWWDAPGNRERWLAHELSEKTAAGQPGLDDADNDQREGGSSANTDEPRKKSPSPADELARRRAWEAIPDDAAAYDTGEPSEYEKQVEQQDRAAERPDESGEE